MGLMTVAAGGAAVCPTAGKKCEVKLERLATSAATSSSASLDSSKFKRPISSIKSVAEDFDDLRPPVKLKVKIGTNGSRSGSPSCMLVNPSSTTSDRIIPLKSSAQLSRATARGHGLLPAKGAAMSAPMGGAPMNIPIASKKHTLPPYDPPPPPDKPFSLDLDSQALKQEIGKLGFDEAGRISTSLLLDAASSKGSVCTPKPTVPLTEGELLPLTPSVYVNTMDEAFSPQLLDICLKRPIVLVRNLANACNMDLSLYSTKRLVETHPNHAVEVRSQMEQTSDENWAPNMESPVWYCTSSRSHTTIAKYAEYQAETIQEHYSTHSEPSANPKFDFSGNPTRRTIKFGTNCDLSDDKKWGPQLKELNKLPAWARVISAGNMLSHIGNQILGMNTVQLYMKVPCARTPGHQENNNFCAVNINIGPGDSEWFGVPNDYWGVLQNMCAKNQVDYLHGSWWPKMEELREAGIPCYRFMQRPGDLVWVNAGCVHWVQAAGWCNNIAWNVGPLTDRQYLLAMERYEWNKSQRFQSIVAMCLLSWNLARNLKPTCPKLHAYIKGTLQQTLRFSMQTQAFVKSKGIPIRFHGRRKNEPAHYCGVCDEEVFNNLFVKENEKKYVVHCLNCSLEQSPQLKGFICLEEWTEEELLQVYDDFKLVDRREATLPQSGLEFCETTTRIPSQI